MKTPRQGFHHGGKPPWQMPKAKASTSNRGSKPSDNSKANTNAGYVFCCGDDMMAECLTLRLFGAPAAELRQMKTNILLNSEILLFNVDTLTLIGRFVADGLPRLNIDSDAFPMGDFRAQVRVKTLDLCPLEVELQGFIESGPKSLTDMEGLRECLKQGRPSTFDFRAVPQEPARKRKLEQIVKKEEYDEDEMQAGWVPPGSSYLYRHVKGELSDESVPSAMSGSGSYLFHCNNATERECLSLNLFGCPDREMSRMNRAIKPGMQVLLLNIESLYLFGPFVAVDCPGLKLEPGAFGGRFNAQVRVELHEPLRKARVDRWMATGPKLGEDVKVLLQRLRSFGDRAPALPGSRQVFGEASRKKPKLEETHHRSQVTLRSLVKVEELSEEEYEEIPVEESSDADPAAYDYPEDFTKSPCWDFVNGTCPRGEKCRYPHMTGPSKGYVFMCSNSTLLECGEAALLGSPLKELPLMKHFIADDTQLFLFNFDANLLVGTFSSLGLPEKNIKADAFKGKFSAQVAVVPMDQPLLSARFDKRIAGGPKSEAQVEELITRLAEGEMAAPDVQQAWGLLV